jgi:hypothetical protein
MTTLITLVVLTVAAFSFHVWLYLKKQQKDDDDGESR